MRRAWSIPRAAQHGGKCAWHVRPKRLKPWPVLTPNGANQIARSCCPCHTSSLTVDLRTAQSQRWFPEDFLSHFERKTTFFGTTYDVIPAESSLSFVSSAQLCHTLISDDPADASAVLLGHFQHVHKTPWFRKI